MKRFIIVYKSKAENWGVAKVVKTESKKEALWEAWRHIPGVLIPQDMELVEIKEM